MNNIIKLNIGGEFRTLEFNFGTLEHIETITGEDPLTFSVDVKDYQSVKKGAQVLIEAGIKTYDEQAPFDQTWVKKLPMADILKAFQAWGNSKRMDTSGEVEADTQPQAANVAGT